MVMKLHLVIPVPIPDLNKDKEQGYSDGKYEE